ncbi:hypothetical protein Tco_0332755 [Tanacetum coccineum]
MRRHHYPLQMTKSHDSDKKALISLDQVKSGTVRDCLLAPTINLRGKAGSPVSERGNKTDEGLPEDTSARQRKSARKTHIRKSRLQADPCLTRVPLRLTNRKSSHHLV